MKKLALAALVFTLSAPLAAHDSPQKVQEWLDYFESYKTSMLVDILSDTVKSSLPYDPYDLQQEIQVLTQKVKAAKEASCHGAVK